MKRRSKYKRRAFLWQFILASSLGLALFLILFFLGIPLLAKLSLFFEKGKGEETIIQNDQTAPFPPQLETPLTATNSARIIVRGTSEPDSTVTLYLNNQALDKILVGKDGSFTKRITLREEKNKIIGQAIDRAGNESTFSSSLLIVYKRKSPLLEIEFPPDEDFETDKDEIEVKGKTDPGMNLNINNRFVLVNNDGSFNHFISLSEGENLIEIVVADEAGNESKAERKIIYSPSD